jgi:membrane-bound lytic murein transglycosylase F
MLSSDISISRSHSSPCRTAALALIASITACSEQSLTKVGVEQAQELRIATIAPATDAKGNQPGYRGFEHDLATAFAHYIGATPHFVVARNEKELLKLVRGGTVDMAAGLVPVRNTPPDGVLLGPSYMTSRPFVIYRRGSSKPQTFADLRGKHIAASKELGLRGMLEKNLSVEAGYVWPVRGALRAEELLAHVERGLLDYAVMLSIEFEALQRLYPETEVAFEFGVPSAIAWRYSADRHHDLGKKQLEFFRALRQNGTLSGMVSRYFNEPRSFDYVQTRAFLDHYAERLPVYREAFEKAASVHKLDWLLLAAMSYQESHWRNDATSPTGVRGLMMLTKNTAESLAVDRIDPIASIDGGAQYLNLLKARLPARINDPDRTWLALAAYNIGYAHLERARALTDGAGRDPDNWLHVRRYLPQVGRPASAYSDKGLAPGDQAVKFVDNTRRYYETLRWLEGDLRGGAIAFSATTTTNSPML